MILSATVSVVEAAELLGASEVDVRAELYRGRLAGSHIGGGTRIGWRSLAALLENRFGAQPERLADVLRRLATTRAGIPDFLPLEETQPEDGASAGERGGAGRRADGGYRLALLPEAARAAGGSDRLARMAHEPRSKTPVS